MAYATDLMAADFGLLPDLIGVHARVAILDWVNGQVGTTQRLSALHPVAELPRSAIGKVLKRELRDRLTKVAP